ncbi:PfkB family carbohydrate kinase [Escherichia coli]|nr:PfkB family carbohydrate kinase [Escherichia coli]
MIRVACVGITVMDRIYYVEGLPTESGKYVARNYTEVGGGPAATAAVAAARLGAQVDFIGRVGDDDTGNSLLAELESRALTPVTPNGITQAKSSQSAIMVDAKGERIIINYPSPDLLPDAEWLEKSISLSGMLCWQMYAGTTVLKSLHSGPAGGRDDRSGRGHYAAGYQRAGGIKRSRGLFRTGSGALNGRERWPVRLKQARNAHKWSCLCDPGSAGCDWLENGGRQHQPAFKVDVVDTTGAGDVFHGALAVALATGGNLASQFASPAVWRR